MPTADIYKQGVLAAKLHRERAGNSFEYESSYVLNRGEPVATTLPFSHDPVDTPPGAIPPYFAGLLPEGRRLNALIRHLKVSADDEFRLLTAVGRNAIGDVIVTPEGEPPEQQSDSVKIPPTIGESRFADLIGGVPEFAAIAGVQDKVSSRMISLPAEKAGHDYILKVNPPEYPRLVQNEANFLALAGRCGIAHAEAELVTDSDATRLELRRRGGSAARAFRASRFCCRHRQRRRPREELLHPQARWRVACCTGLRPALVGLLRRLHTRALDRRQEDSAVTPQIA